ncbi:unnamed protein product [Heligmosomoides polygyrus]|uniref:Uncharacterized protein n=1 Tax=Heligmosomoides polygyrus TaxID=6339 RepID=A0A183F5H5_HELPZ|nr:unnamed protein product [Heligmosomoides polygyrus]
MCRLGNESSAFSVYQKFGAEESLVWTQSGIPLAGWNRIRLPLRLSPLPSKFEIRASTKPGQFVAVTNTNIVDGNGRDLACGGDLQVIRPHNGDLIRLTADVKVPKLYVMSTTTSMPTVEPLRRTSLTSPDVVSAPATYKDQRQSAQFAALPISPAIVSSARLRGSTLYSTGAAAALPEEKGNPKSIPAPTKLTTCVPLPLNFVLFLTKPKQMLLPRPFSWRVST